MPLNYPRSGYFLASYTLIQLVLILGRADFSRNEKTAQPEDLVYFVNISAFTSVLPASVVVGVPFGLQSFMLHRYCTIYINISTFMSVLPASVDGVGLVLSRFQNFMVQWYCTS